VDYGALAKRNEEHLKQRKAAMEKAKIKGPMKMAPKGGKK
jgi:hypothetical protein